MRIFIFILFFTINLFATPVVEIKHTNKVTTHFSINYLFNKNENLTFNEIVNLPFTKTSKSSFALGYTTETVWIKIKLKNNTEDENFIMTLNENFYEKANLYYKENNKWIKKENGIFKSLKQREIKSNDLAFNIYIKPFEQKVFYLELQGKYSYFGNIEIYEQSYFQYKNTLNKNEFHIVLIGIIFTIVLFSFLLFLNTYEKIYLYYLGYALFSIVFLLISSGLLIFVDLQDYIYKFYTFVPFLFVCLILFSKEFLQIEKYLKNMDKFLNILILFFVLCAVLLFFSFTPWNKVLNILIIITMVFLIIVSTIIFFKGNHRSKYYIFALLTYFTGVIIYTLTVQGILEYQIVTRYGYLLTLFIEILIFTILLANRYTEIKGKMESYLKLQVKERTKEIETLLDDKELLLKELHHRVKNNFHMIMGILYIENKKKDYINNGLDSLINRIKSISFIHEYLYSSKEISQLNIKEYLNKLLLNITNTHTSVQMKIKVDPIIIKLDDAISLGMIVNELITNSIKHNENMKNLSIELILREEKGKFFLSIKDNGFNTQDKNFKKNLGLKLIEQFSNKLNNSQYEFIVDDGTKFVLEFTKD